MFTNKPLIWITAVSLILCACQAEEITQDEGIYTPEELGMIVEWTRGGWSEVYNELDSQVTLVTTYYSDNQESQTVTSVIKPGSFVTLDAGAYLPGISIDECQTASIRISEDEEILCTRGALNPWTYSFFKNFEQRKEFEIVELDGKKVRHDMVVRTYHISNTLLKLWQAERDRRFEKNGIYLNGECLVDIGSTFMGGGTADPKKGSSHRCHMYEQVFAVGPNWDEVDPVVSFSGFSYEGVNYHLPGQHLDRIAISFPSRVANLGSTLIIPLAQGEYKGGSGSVTSVSIFDYTPGSFNFDTGEMNDGKIDIAITLSDGRTLDIYYRGVILHDNYY